MTNSNTGQDLDDIINSTLCTGGQNKPKQQELHKSNTSSPKSQRKQFTIKTFLMYDHKVTQLATLKINPKQNSKDLHPE